MVCGLLKCLLIIIQSVSFSCIIHLVIDSRTELGATQIYSRGWERDTPM